MLPRLISDQHPLVMENNLIDREWYSFWDKSLQAISDELAAVGNVEGIQDQINAINDQITDIQNEITSIQGDISLIQASINSINSQIATLTAQVTALANSILFTKDKVNVTAAYVVPSGDNSKTLVLGGTTSYEVTYTAPGGYPADHSNMIYNSSTTRARFINVAGWGTFWLYPLQWTIVSRNGSGAWMAQGPGRYKVAGGTFYCDPAGNDSNDGLDTSQPMQGIQTAVNRVIADVEGLWTVKLAQGTYSVGSGVTIVVPAPAGSNQIVIEGDQASPTLYTVVCNAGGNCFNVQDGAIVTLRGLNLRTVGNGSTAVISRQKAIVDLFGVDFEGFPAGVHINVTTWASVNLLGNYAVRGNVNTHISVSNNAFLQYGTFTINITLPIVFANWLSVSNCSTVTNGGLAVNFVGPGAGVASTGTQYSVTTNSVATVGVSLPGNNPGSTSTGGIYF